MRSLGIDYGTKKVGIALSDESGTLAFPKAILKNDHTLLDEIEHLCSEENVQTIVIGESRDNKGNENVLMQNVRTFVDLLERRVAAKVYFEPEYMTSTQVRREGGAGRVDAGAATLILQSFIDRQKTKTKGPLH